MTKPQLRRLFRKHYGEGARLARELSLSRATISRWLRGHVKSGRIEAAIAKRAQELMEDEQVKSL